MDDNIIFEELVVLLEQNGVSVRHEPMGGAGGGLCYINKKHVCFVDTESGTLSNAASCAEAVSCLIDVDNIYIRPVVREFIDKHKKSD